MTAILGGGQIIGPLCPYAYMCCIYSLQMSVEETEQLLDKLGIPAAEGGGVPYNNLIPYLVQAIEGPQ